MGFKNLVVLTLSLGFIVGCKNSSDHGQYLSSNIKMYTPDQVHNILAKQKLAKSDVIDGLSYLKLNFKSSYIGYNIKKQLIGKSGDQIFNECLAETEKVLTAKPDGLSTLEYYDEVRKCVAKFRDTHLYFSSSDMATGSSYIFSLIMSTRIVEGKVVITTVLPNMIDKIESKNKLVKGSLLTMIKPGFEIVEIDGKPALKVIEDFKKYSGSGNINDGLQRAASDFFARDYAYPTSNEVNVTIKDMSGKTQVITMPWIQGTVRSLESEMDLAKKNIITRSSLASDDQALMKPNTIEPQGNIFLNMVGEKEFYSANSADSGVVMTLGLANIATGKNACYMRLNSFMIEQDQATGAFQVYQKVGKGLTKQSFAQVIAKQLTDCESANLPLIFDLRNNGGGDAQVSDLIYTLLESKDSKTTLGASSYALNIANTSIINNMLRSSAKINTDIYRNYIFQATEKGIAEKAVLSDWVVSKMPAAIKPIFSHKVVVLVSNNCVSACESTSNRLQKSGRAVVMGTQTSGTGWGFASNQAKTTARDLNQKFEINIPNFAFQSIVVDDLSKFEKDAETGMVVGLVKLSDLPLLENTGVKPNVVVDYTLKDLTGDFEDYKTKLAQYLN